MKEYQLQNNNGSKTIQDFNRQCAKERTQFSHSPSKKHQKRVHNYIIETNELLGEGSFSSVYRGKNIKTNADVAIKVIKLKTIAKTGIERLFSEQLNIIQQLKHPNIVACYEYFRTNNNCYTVYHFCKGGDLAKLLLKGHLGEREDLHQANILIKDIFQGLLYLESMNIVHRDIKTANIFIDHGKAKIGDFGFATRCTSQFKDASIGSPAYMAPEALLHNIYGPKTDVWAFGMLLYEMLHGYSPFFECASQRQLRARISIPLNWDQLKANLPSPLKRLILKCLKIDPLERSTFTQLLNDQYIQKIYAESPMNRIWNKSSYSKKTADSEHLIDSANLSIISKHSRRSSNFRQSEQDKITFSQPGLYEKQDEINEQNKTEQYYYKKEYFQAQSLAVPQFQQNNTVADQLQSKPLHNLQKTQLKECIFLQENSSNQLQSQEFLQIITILISTYQLSFLIDHKEASQSLFQNLINQLSQQLYIVNKQKNPDIAEKTAQLYEKTSFDIEIYYQLPVHQSKYDLYKLGLEYLFATIKMVENLIDKEDISCSNTNSKSTLSSTLVLYGNHLIICYHIFDHLSRNTSPFPIINTSKTKSLSSSEQFYIWLYQLQLQRMELIQLVQFQ